jgi:hypothetical protein
MGPNDDLDLKTQLELINDVQTKPRTYATVNAIHVSIKNERKRKIEYEKIVFVSPVKMNLFPSPE